MGYMPGDVLLLRLMKWTGNFDEQWYVGKNLPRLKRLMELDTIVTVAGRAGRDIKLLDPTELLVLKHIDEMRENDEHFHGPVDNHNEDMFAPFFEHDEPVIGE